jgi:HPt (histidine-containing phosphotransfer) domain-containing protein
MIHLGLKRKIEENTPLVNLQFLEETMRGNKKAIEETINIFIEHLPEDLKAVVDGVEKEDFSAIRRSAHKLRSSAAIMGIKKIEEILQEMEELAASEKEMTRLIELKESLVLLGEKVKGEIEGLSKQ